MAGGTWIRLLLRLVPGQQRLSSSRVAAMITIVGFAGSLRQGSYNAALLRAAGAMMPTESELHAASIREFPLYNGDDEAAHGVPPAVTALKDAIAAADGLLLVTPEYNN